jgi:molecular chaperone HtpG
LLERIKTALGERTKDVRASNRLVESPACLVADEHGVSAQMEAMMRRMGQPVPEQKRTLELNPGHPLVQRLSALHGDSARRTEVADGLHLLRDQATLAAGGTVSDGAATAKRLQALLIKALGGSSTSST